MIKSESYLREMPTIEELNTMADAMFGKLWARDVSKTCSIVVGEDRFQVMMAAISHKRNDILADILTVMDK